VQTLLEELLVRWIAECMHTALWASSLSDALDAIYCDTCEGLAHSIQFVVCDKGWELTNENALHLLEWHGGLVVVHPHFGEGGEAYEVPQNFVQRSFWELLMQ